MKKLFLTSIAALFLATGTLRLVQARLFGGADHGLQNVGLERRAWPLAQAVCGSVGSQGTATNVPALRVGTDRSWRSQEHSADGEAACAGRMRPIAPLHCRRGLGCNASGNRTAYPSR